MTESQSTPKPLSVLNFALTAVVFAILGVLITLLVLQDDDDSPSTAEINQIVQNAVGTQVALSGPASNAPTPTATRVAVTKAADDDAFKGPADAPVVIVEFSDFRCQYCGRFYKDTLPQILDTYPDDVKFVYRDFPIFGEESARASMAAECAEEQDAFWAMHDMIFDTREAANPAPLTQDTLVSYAGDLALDTDTFAECLSSERYLEEVINDYQAAAGYGFTGTPAFLINGQYVSGAQPFAVFDQIIQDKLANVG